MAEKLVSLASSSLYFVSQHRRNEALLSAIVEHGTSGIGSPVCHLGLMIPRYVRTTYPKIGKHGELMAFDGHRDPRLNSRISLPSRAGR